MTDINSKHDLKRKAKKATRKDVGETLGRQKEVEAKVKSSGVLRRFFGDVVDMGAMLRDVSTGRYRQVPWGTISAVTVTLGYVFMPFDAIPDMIPVIGLTDDAAVVALCLSLVQDDLDAYRRWRSR